MKLRNRSAYDTKALRRVVTMVHRDLARAEGRLKSWRWLTVVVETSRPGKRRGNDYHFTSGRATRNWIMLRPPAPHRSGGATFTRTFAYTVRHELLHAYGYDHGQFVDREPDNIEQIIAAVGERLPLKVVQTKPQPPVAERRYALVLEAEARWTRKLKLAQTKLRRLRTRRRYYEKRAALVDKNPIGRP
jgi:hypothetical protein